MPWIVVQDVEDVCVTLAWEGEKGAQTYEVQLQAEGAEWVVVSDKLQSTMVRKKNLSPGTSYLARARAAGGGFGEAVAFQTLPEGGGKRMDAPAVQLADGEGITVAWKEADGAEAYEVQWRSDAMGEWQVASSTLKGTAVRKKNLVAATNHYFRVRPSQVKDGAVWAFSPPSQGAALAVLSPFLSNLLGGPDARLVNSQGKEVTAKSLAGQVVALYASASWCGPCRQFTPQLINFYVQMKQAKTPFEIVLLSCDRDKKSFEGYLGHMPWWALDYDSDAREESLGKISVQGIPHLAVCGRDGALIDGKVNLNSLNAATMTRWLQGLKS
mmetsp:Transcript_58088/g.140032  ORF Transcript_58088/g.140032 Transcript_58088/m.140032 type:complete len:327 (-) Transcript_58088:55-1035(-)